MRRLLVCAAAFGCAAATSPPGAPAASPARAASAARPVVTVSPVAPVSARTGGALVRGTVRCARPAIVHLRIRVTQSGGPLPLATAIDPVAYGPAGRGPTWLNDVDSGPVRCGRRATRWTQRMFALGGSFRGGTARVRVQVPRGAGTTTTVRLTARAPRQRRYEVALGDSLAVGYDSPPGQSYVQDLFRRATAAVPGLALVNFGCIGATTASLVGGGGCAYPGGRSQLEAAVRFLRAHARQVRLVTIDIGGNDFLDCLRTPAVDPGCVDRTLGDVRVRLTSILARLRTAAGPSTPIVSMTYFNPALVHWFAGAAGQARARASAAGAARLSAVIRSVYEPAGSPVADVAGAFAVDDVTPVPETPWGPLPRNVARVCEWLDNRCPAPGAPPAPATFGVDTNAAGSRVIAAAFARVIPPLAR